MDRYLSRTKESSMAHAANLADLTRRLPTPEEIQSAAEAATALAQAKSHDGALTVGGSEGNELRLAPAISDLLVDLLGHIAQGEMVTFVPVGAMLTTQQAADMLNVSRPYLSSLLKQGAIPFVPVGSHRRVRFEDLMAYKERRDGIRATALDELARLGQEFDAS
jgi:excisionase family DNA binding protein